MSDYGYTRSGRTIMPPPPPPPRAPLTVVYYAPKPDWMTHIPGPWLRFRGKQAFLAHLARVRERT